MTAAFLDIGNVLRLVPETGPAQADFCRFRSSARRMADIDRLTLLIEPVVDAEGLALVRVRLTGGGGDPTLQVMAERAETRQLNLEDCARLSRRISAMLDELEAQGDDPIDHAYRLEVSSPGIDRPLTRLQDFEDWKGHQARISLVEKVLERKQLTGPLLGVERELIGVDVPGHGEMWITLANIHGAKLVMTDKLIAATAPLSPEGADQIVEIEEDGTPPEGEAPDSKVEGQD
jgi:ribosome maturation factor RimP